MTTTTYYSPSLESVKEAQLRLKEVVMQSPLQFNQTRSEKYNANVYFKREDLQLVRSYKIRGAFNLISSLTEEQRSNGIVAASAGNHAQGVAYACKLLKIKGTLFMPRTTPAQKVEQVKMFGSDWVSVNLIGDTFDDALEEASKYVSKSNGIFVPPFDHEKIIEGQATIALELLAQSEHPIDYLFLPVGGGGLGAGVAKIMKEFSPKTKIVGVEPAGAPSLSISLERNANTTLARIDKFVDGAAVKRVGELNFKLLRAHLDEVVTIEEGNVCEELLSLYNRDAIVAEPAGVLGIAALSIYKDELKGKNVVCLLSGGNNDITRMEEIKERALLYQGLQHYFIVNFNQRPGALREFVTDVMGVNDDITFFQFSQKTNREKGPAVVGVRLSDPNDFEGLIKRMKESNMFVDYLNEKKEMMSLFV